MDQSYPLFFRDDSVRPQREKRGGGLVVLENRVTDISKYQIIKS